MGKENPERYINSYRCPECDGHGHISDYCHRIVVDHKFDCLLWNYFIARHPVALSWVEVDECESVS